MLSSEEGSIFNEESSIFSEEGSLFKRNISDTGSSVGELSHLADGEWDTALRRAITQGKLQLFENIISKGSTQAIQSYVTEHPFHFLLTNPHIYGGRLEMLNILVELGANINLQSSDGSSPLHILCQCQSARYGWGYLQLNVDLIEALLDKGADIDLQNRHGETPLQVLARKVDPYNQYQATMLYRRNLAVIWRFLLKKTDTDTVMKSGKALFEFSFNLRKRFLSRHDHAEFENHPMWEILCKNVHLGNPLSTFRCTKYSKR
jgi:hypothetical protein